MHSIGYGPPVFLVDIVAIFQGHRGIVLRVREKRTKQTLFLTFF
jgi:hypothetical protein